MKTTEDIFDNCNDFELNNLRDFDNKNVYNKLKFWNKKWYSEEEIRTKINKLKDFYNNQGKDTNENKWYNRLDAIAEIEVVLFEVKKENEN